MVQILFFENGIVFDLQVQGLLLGGCTSNSPGIPPLFLIQLRGGAGKSVNVGYYGRSSISSRGNITHHPVQVFA